MNRHHAGSYQPSARDCMRLDKAANNRFVVLTKVTAVLFLACLWALPLRAQLGAGFTTIDPPQSGFTIAFGINDHLKIVGTYYDSGGLGHGFLRNQDGRFVNIDHPQAQTVNGFGTEARGINSAGLIVGDYCAAPPCDGVSVIKGYLLTGDRDEKDEFDKADFKTLETPGHINSYLQHINAEGDIVGCEHDADTRASMHGIVRDDSKVTASPVPFSMHNGINKREEIVGFYVDPSTGRQHGYLLTKGVATLIDFPGAVATAAWDINNRGQVVGGYKKDGVTHGFLWQKGKFTSVNIPGALFTNVFGINSAGDMVGLYQDGTTGHGFLLRAEDTESGGDGDK
jgi:probable HAF family extracellular repeat protein